MPKVVRFSEMGGTEKLFFSDEDVPPPRLGEVQIEMHAAGLNRAELLFTQGRYLLQPKLPSRLGFEGAGSVLAVGEEVSDLRVGDRVAITPNFDFNEYGVLAEKANVPAAALLPIPDNVDFVTAAAFWMAFGTALGMMSVAGGLKRNRNQIVFLNGASSSVGTAAFQIIREYGGLSIASTRSHSKASELRNMGADHVLVTEANDWGTQLLDVTDGVGFDIGCDCVGGAMQAEMARVAAPHATIVQYGRLSGEDAPVPTTEMFMKGLRLTGFHLTAQVLAVPDQKPLIDELMLDLRRGRYASVVSRTFPFDRVTDAYAYMASNKQIGKIVVDFSS